MFPFVIISNNHSLFVVTAFVTVWHIAYCLKHGVLWLGCLKYWSFWWKSLFSMNDILFLTVPLCLSYV